MSMTVSRRTSKEEEYGETQPREACGLGLVSRMVYIVKLWRSDGCAIFVGAKFGRCDNKAGSGLLFRVE